MNKITLTSSILLITISSVILHGHVNATDKNKPHYFLQSACLDALNEQVNWELYASIVYMNMYGYFNKPGVGLSGYAKFFKEQSKEEYDHALKMVDYVNSRNGSISQIVVEPSPKSEWDSPKEAIEDAIKLEHHVYAKLQYAHSVADQKCQDPQLMDFLTNEYFAEQIRSIAELTRMHSKLGATGSQDSALLTYLEDARIRGKDEL